LNSGKTASCHRASSSNIPEDFASFHNTDIKIKAREDMLQGKWPGHGCEYCKNIENAGGTSDRQFQNQIPNAHPPELDLNNSLTEVSPTTVEVFFSNTCNLACVYCKASLSSTIQAENKKFNGAIMPELDHQYQDNQYKNLIPKFWNWITDHGQSLQRLHILGGEPFLQKEVSELIDFYKTNPNANLEFNLVTNLSFADSIFLPYVKKLTDLVQTNSVKRIDIQCSIDCWGPSQSYIRHGINLDLFEKNITKLIDNDAIRVGLLTTVTSLSIPSMIDLAEKRNHWQTAREIFWYMHLVLPANDSVFDPTIFDYEIYKPYMDRVYKCLPRKTWDDEQTFNVFDGIVAKLKANCKTDILRQQHLLGYLEKNDQRRNTNWKQSFPWLETEFRKNNVV
jgi:organic radical activating enzyme